MNDGNPPVNLSLYTNIVMKRNLPYQQGDRPVRRGIYFLPNALTTAALFCGFFAVVQAMNGRFMIAAIAIFCALIFDGMDGRVARLTNSQSEFGAQYDSLSDMVSFGVAPSLVMYEWGLVNLGKWGWLAAFIYCAGAALRLARFNTNSEVLDKRFFQGLPSPAAASLIAGFVWVLDDNKISAQTVLWPAFFLTLFAGFAMVSNLPYHSFKDLSRRKSVPFVAILLVVMAFTVIAFDPPLFLFGLFVTYFLSGLLLGVWRLRNKQSAPMKPEDA